MGIAERKKSEREARIKLIIDSAKSVFHNKGFYNSTIEDIAACAELSKATIYHYFASKTDLYICSFVQPAIKNLTRRLSKIAADKQEGPEKRLRRQIRVIHDFYKKNRHEYDILINFKESEYVKLLPQDRLTNFKKIMREGMRQSDIVIKEGSDMGIFIDINPYIASLILWSAFTGMMQFGENRISRGKKDYREASLEYLEIIIDGLKKK